MAYSAKNPRFSTRIRPFYHRVYPRPKLPIYQVVLLCHFRVSRTCQIFMSKWLICWVQFCAKGRIAIHANVKLCSSPYWKCWFSNTIYFRENQLIKCTNNPYRNRKYCHLIRIRDIFCKQGDNKKLLTNAPWLVIIFLHERKVRLLHARASSLKIKYADFSVKTKRN